MEERRREMGSEIQGREAGGDEGGGDRGSDSTPGCAFLIVDTLVKATLVGFFYVLFATIRVQLGI
jgi:hypothetical protein